MSDRTKYPATVWTDVRSRTQNERGEWMPAIPEPYFLVFGRARCDCGAKFRNRRRYREHYAFAHILGLTR